MTRAPQAQRSLDRAASSPELTAMMEAALKCQHEQGRIPFYMLTAVMAAIRSAMTNADEPNAPPDWTPLPDQIWRGGERDKNGRKITAWDAFKRGYADLPYAQRPYTHQLRQNPQTKELYDALCVVVSRNKTRGIAPSSIGELFPMTMEARAGKLSEHNRPGSSRKPQGRD